MLKMATNRHFFVCYNYSMQTKVLIVGVVKNDGAILMRKKPAGSPPYTETWYIFGAEATADVNPDDAIIAEVLAKSGVTVKVTSKISWDTEVKHDLDGIEKFFVYLDVECEYVSGDIQAAEGIEKIEWVKYADLDSYDIVPPSRILFEKLGYLN
ncbi:MAG: hypothetical protein JWM07_349 [Candidatus Saccharibacteria bacterium]|nr:hypothetical protein [Candidatus Saccharibacteria bacterium]